MLRSEEYFTYVNIKLLLTNSVEHSVNQDNI